MSYSPRFTITPRLLSSLEEILSIQGRIEHAPIQVSWVPALEREALARTAHGTAAIEGNPLSLQEVKTVVEGRPLSAAPSKPIYDIKNVLEVLRTIESLASAPQLREEDIFKIHRLLGQQNTLERGPIGAYRDYGVEVGDHKGVHPEDVPKGMADLLAWVNGEGAQWPALITSAVLHFRFEFLHPFGDGNGRVGRALALWVLYKRQFKTQHFFSIEEIFWEKRDAYFAALHQVDTQPEHDLSHWIEFVADALVAALQRTLARIEILPQTGTGSFVLSPNQEKLLELLRNLPMGIAMILGSLKVTKQGAHYILKPLLEKGLIERVGGHKTGIYRLKT